MGTARRQDLKNNSKLLGVVPIYFKIAGYVYLDMLQIFAI
jgi:hypothetical protein